MAARAELRLVEHLQRDDVVLFDDIYGRPESRPGRVIHLSIHRSHVLVRYTTTVGTHVARLHPGTEVLVRMR